MVRGSKPSVLKPTVLKAEEAITAAEMSIANWLPMPDYNQRTEALHKVGCNTSKSLPASFGCTLTLMHNHVELTSYTAQRDESEALRWFTQAKQDLAAAIANQQDRPFLAVFLCEQASEKSLKGRGKYICGLSDAASDFTQQVFLEILDALASA